MSELPPESTGVVDASVVRTTTDPIQGYSPAGQLLNLITGYWITQAICTAAELGLADQMSRRARPVAELAQVSGTHEASLYRLLRALSSIGIFKESTPGCFALTPMAVLLRDDTPGNLRAFARMQADRWHWQCWGDLTTSVRSGARAISLTTGFDHCFDYLDAHPDSARIFHDAMNGYAAQVHAAVVDSYDFSRARRIVDIGGGSGALLAEILRTAPSATGVLLDRADALVQAREHLRHDGLADRCELVAGDFFIAVPQRADLYLLSNVLHDWDDDQAVAILRRVAEALDPAARLLIIENILPDGDQAHPGKFVDLEMMLIARGRERHAAEFAVLLAKAGLVAGRQIETAVPASLLEVRLR